MFRAGVLYSFFSPLYSSNHYLNNIMSTSYEWIRRRLPHSLSQSNMYNPDTDELRRVGNLWALGFVGLGLCALCGHMAMAIGFSVSGERLTRTLRNMAFNAMVRNRSWSIISCHSESCEEYALGVHPYIHIVKNRYDSLYFVVWLFVDDSLCLVTLLFGGFFAKKSHVNDDHCYYCCWFLIHVSKTLEIYPRLLQIRHDVAWFDKEENAVGVLTTRLEGDASLVRDVQYL